MLVPFRLFTARSARRLLGRAAGVAAVLVMAAAASAPQAAQAMTVLQVDLPTLVSTAAVVAHGVIDRSAVIDRRKEGRGIWTEYSLKIQEVWKGDAKSIGPRFTWRHVGGTAADGVSVLVPGLAGFVPGEEVVVVLEQHAQGFVVSAGPQGKFVVRKDKLGRKTVMCDLHDVHMVRRDPVTGQMAEAPRTVQVVRFLDEFRKEVLGHVAAQSKAAAPSGAPAKPPAAAKPAPLGK